MVSKIEYYIYESASEKKILQSLTLVEKYTSVPYRTLIRKFSGVNSFCDEKGLFRIDKVEFIQDGRKRNSNPNLNK